MRIPNYSSVSTFFIVATPIGNDADLTPRAREILSSVDVVLSEDTRRYGLRAKAWGLPTKSIALHEHNESEQAEALVQMMLEGRSVALVSDAGTPLVSDPGFVIVRAAHRAGIKVVPLPGASAVMTALCAAGIASDRFFFEGFLPNKSVARKARLAELRSVEATLIFLESPRRVLRSLEDIFATYGDVELAFCRELSKRHETIKLAAVSLIIDFVKADPQQQLGEIVLLCRLDKAQQVLDANWQSMAQDMLNHLPPRQVAKLIAKWSGQKAREIYASLV